MGGQFSLGGSKDNIWRKSMIEASRVDGGNSLTLRNFD